MQSLLVRFEPPDVYGVPASEQEAIPPKFSHDNTVSELLLDVASLPLHPQPSSLPTNLEASSQVASPTSFQSLPPLNKLSKYKRIPVPLK